MHAIVLAWKNALDVLKPHRLLTLTTSSIKSLGKGSYAFIRSFWWLLLADAGLFLLLGNYTSSPEALQAIAKNHSFILLVILFIQSIVWFLASTFFFLLMHREESSDDYVYCAVHVLKYCQITMLPPLMFFLGLYLLISLTGISALPGIPWLPTLCLRACGLMVIFYWLDTTIPTFTNFLSAIERGINLCFYNLPLIALFIGVALLINFGGSVLIAYLFGQPVAHIFMTQVPGLLSAHVGSLKGRCLVLLVKYSVFFIESLWMAFMLSIYRRKRNEEYTAMFFS